MTPEELTHGYIEKMLRNGPGSAGMSDEEAESLYRLALIATDPQAEADRRLGAKVRNSAPQSFDLATTLAEAARELDGVQFPIAAGALRAIAAALREEAGR